MEHYKIPPSKGWIRKSFHFTIPFVIWIQNSYSWSFSSQSSSSSSSSSWRKNKHSYRKQSIPSSSYSSICSLQKDNNQIQPTISSSTEPDKKKDYVLNDILMELNQKFHYEGRLPSGTVSPMSHSNNNNTLHFRCGFIALVGAPNMGKSSLVNALLEEELCITTHRPQTTRHAILAILNAPSTLQCQLCFIDTPGILQQPAYKLQEGMMEAVQGAVQDADVLLLVTDIFSTPIPNDVLFQRVVHLSKTQQKKVIVAINKVDLLHKVINKTKKKQGQEKETTNNHPQDTNSEMKIPVTLPDAIMYWRQLLPDAIAILPMSASKGGKDMGVVALRTLLMGGPNMMQAFQNLVGDEPIPGMFINTTSPTEEYAKQIIPISPPLYSQDTLTDRNSR